MKATAGTTKQFGLAAYVGGAAAKAGTKAVAAPFHLTVATKNLTEAEKAWVAIAAELGLK